MAGILSRQIADTPVAVIELETTGFVPGFDRVVEVSVVRVEPREEPKLAFDTLINPQRLMAATEIHGITDADVANAPTFKEVVGEILNVINGCVIASYNVYFDIRFLDFELRNASIGHDPPHICLMYMRPMLGLGPRCTLGEACRIHSIKYIEGHKASCDALSASQLFTYYLTEIQQQGVVTYKDLAMLRSYKFSDSFHCTPFPDLSYFGLKRFEGIVSRAGIETVVHPREAIMSYWESLKMVLADIDVSDEEISVMQNLRQQANIQPEQLRALHAKAFAGVISQVASDKCINDRESHILRKLYRSLSKLGWAPGE